MLCTAHVKSSARKSSRSCIANFVRVFKDLRPVIDCFYHEGVQSSNNTYTKLCIILILPNLLLLDTTVISAECEEFRRLILGLVREAESSKIEETKNAAAKVIKELSAKFKEFPRILVEIQPHANELLSPRLRVGEDTMLQINKIKSSTSINNPKSLVQDRVEFGFLS